jgi:short subunit dehydrogenase-like uncharacterized protein
MHEDFLLYGSYGYTGSLIANEALRRGMRPKLAGRDAEKLADQAKALGLEFHHASLEDSAALKEALSEVPLVLHCAGPFSRTSQPMVEACMRAGKHYLDISGEIDVFERLAALDDQAKERGMMLLPGVGFIAAPGDCLAAHLKARLPSAQTLRLATSSLGRASRGTAKIVIEHLDRPGIVRCGGELVHVPAAWRALQVDFGEGPQWCVTMPLGELSAAYFSTHIPDIEVYLKVSPLQRVLLKLGRHFLWALAPAPMRSLLRWLIDRRPAGPGETERAGGRAVVWGEVIDGQGGGRSHDCARPKPTT